MNKLGNIPKGKSKTFARGGKRPMFGQGDRTQSKHPASPQRPGQTSGQAGKSAVKRTSAKGRAVDEAGAMGGSRGVSNPRRPAACAA
jgi:hypothetical protein